MKSSRRFAVALAVVCLSGAASVPLWAQDANTQPLPPPGGYPPGEHGRMHRPPPPLMEALDTDHDGILSANEIANASTSLKKLDKNGDGQLTEDELRPPPPPDRGPGGPPPQRSARPNPGDQSNTDDAARGPGETTRPAFALHRPDHPPLPNTEEDAFAPARPGPRAANRRGPLPAGPASDADRADADAAHAHRPPPPRLADDPVAARLQAPGPGQDRRPGGSRVRSGALFDLMDTNHDGVLSEEEKRAAMNAVEALNRGGAGQDGDRPVPPPNKEQ